MSGNRIGAAHQANVSTGAGRLVLAVTILGSSLTFIDGSVVSIALPAIGADLKADFGAIQWVVNGYLLMLASLMLLGGSLGDRYGQRRVFIAGLCGFTVASAACAFASSSAVLIAARAVQGAAAALLTPASLALIGAHFSGEARGRAIGTWAAAAALTTAFGPVLGGWLVGSVGWRSIFLINLPLAAIAGLLALRMPADAVAAPETPLDVAGSALAVATLGLASAGLIALGQGQRLQGAIALVLALPAAGAFQWREHTAAAPMMPLALFRDRGFSGANLLTVLLYAALSGALVLLPLFLIDAHRYSATEAGAAMLPFSLVMGLLSRPAGALGARLGPRIALSTGPALAAAGFALLAWLPHDGVSFAAGFLPGLLVLALGMTVAIPPLTTTVLDAVDDALEGTASGINNVAARAGGLMAVAALGLAMGGTPGGVQHSQGLEQAYPIVMLVAALLAAASAVIGAVMIPPRRTA
ncbi:MFS transporter [soil metagenome]